MGKPLLVTVLLVSALAAHFIPSYGVLIDKGMIRNVPETDWRGARASIVGFATVGFAWRGLLGSFGMQTQAYRAELDLWAAARAARSAPGREAAR